jgi:non-specific serine/threonine protein kinase
VGSRIESMKRAAAAHDIAKAQESLARIRTLQPDNPFLAKQGPQLLADAYLGQARNLSERGKYRSAADTLERGLQVLGNRVELRNARDRQAFVADLMQARGKPLVAADIQRLRSRLAALGKADASGLSALQDDLKLHGALPSGGTLSDLLDALKPAAAAPAPAPSAAPGVPAGTPAPGAATPAATKPGTTAPARASAGAAPAAGAASAVAAGPDPCARAGLAGSGRACFDPVGSARGPALVVVPGAGGGPAYAMSRTEITVAEFNRYCSATKQCVAKGGDRDSLALPVSNISLAQAKGYAAWLGQATGRSYRLPSDAEWLHAAQAGKNWTQSPDSNCILPSASADDGSGGPISARGREPNPWGLVNLTGNVWEWTVGSGGTAVRGGSYNSYWSDCTVASHRGDSGQAQKDVGFRVLRELQ